MRPKFPDETRQQIADSVTWTHGKHNFKFGMDFSHVHDLFTEPLALNSEASATTDSGMYFSDLNNPTSCAGKPCYNTYSQAFGPLGFEFSTNDYAFFAAGRLEISQRLSLSLGLRWEYQQLPSVFSNLVNPTFPQTGKLPSDTNNFGPRALALPMMSSATAKPLLRGGYGIYYGRVINSTIFSALSATGIPGSQLTFTLQAN